MTIAQIICNMQQQWVSHQSAIAVSDEKGT